MSLPNHGLKDEISAYWAERAETFDTSIGHGVRTDRERTAWRALFTDLLGPLDGARVLELASGTGEMSAILLSLGADVTGLDLAEPMIARARSKLLERKPHVRFFQGDAENTLEPDGSKDAVVCRHLVWTLIDPAAAFRDWYRVLRPGGRVAIIDGDWVQLPFRGRVQRRLAGLVDRFSGSVDVHHGHDPRHETILSQVYFRNGLKLEDAVRLLTDQGFHSPRLAPLNAVEAGQRSGSQTLGEWLRIGGYRRFALSMEK